MTFDINSLYVIIISALIGGIIGIERESVNRPAGFRTHILVCIAAGLIMDVNIKMAAIYPATDPTRLGAQVISGIGFLGAGTIIKEGATVKGLTTAASLWAVACIGLVVGTGHYLNAIMAMVIMLITLKTFSNLEKRWSKNKRILNLEIATHYKPEIVGYLTVILGDLRCNIKSLDIQTDDSLSEATIIVKLEMPHGLIAQSIIKRVESIDDVISVHSGD